MCIETSAAVHNDMHYTTAKIDSEIITLSLVQIFFFIVIEQLIMAIERRFNALESV